MRAGVVWCGGGQARGAMSGHTRQSVVRKLALFVTTVSFAITVTHGSPHRAPSAHPASAHDRRAQIVLEADPVHPLTSSATLLAAGQVKRPPSNAHRQSQIHLEIVGGSPSRACTRHQCKPPFVATRNFLPHNAKCVARTHSTHRESSGVVWHAVARTRGRPLTRTRALA